MNCEGPDLHELISVLFVAMLSSSLVLFCLFFSLFLLLPGGVLLVCWGRAWGDNFRPADHWSRRAGWCCVTVGSAVILLFLLIGTVGMLADTGKCYPRYEHCDE